MPDRIQSHVSSPHEPTNLSPIVVDRWPSERPLFVMTAVIAVIIWIVLLVTVVGAIYVGVIVLFIGVMKLGLIGQLRGSAVRLGPNQFPELYATVDTLARRMSMRTPEVYLMQAGGDLNAFAIRFIRSNFVVLYSDLLSACGDNTAARDMIIAHELGHIKCGHVRWFWFLLPASFIPFLATALSRAREYTCDRYGVAGAGDRDGAALGLTIFASGGAHASRVNRAELIRQRESVVRSGLMTLAEWFGTHPPLSKRIAEVDPVTAGSARVAGAGPAFAAALLFGIPFMLFVAGWQVAGSDLVSNFRAAMDSTALPGGVGESSSEADAYVVPADAADRARADVARIAQFVEQERKRGSIPWNGTELRQRMAAQYRTEFPLDPYDGEPYAYDQRGEAFIVWSIGPDKESWTDDDIRYDSRVGRIVEPRADSASKQ